MPHINRRTKIRTVTFAALILAGMGLSFLPWNLGPLRTLIYAGICMAWAVSVRERVARPDLRSFFAGMALLMVFLLIVQRTRYDYTSDDPALDRFFHYLYYVPFTVLPVMSAAAAYRLNYGRGRPGVRVLLVVASAALCAAILTNDLHGLCFREGAGPDGYAYGWLYYLAAAWSAGFLAASAALVMHRGLKTPYRRYSWIPAAVLIAALFYFLDNYLHGHPFRLFGKPVLQMQEVFCFTILAFWEACMQTGLIPSSEEAQEFFDRLTIGAQIVDEEGRVCYASAQGRVITGKERADALQAPVVSPDGFLVQSGAIRGGRVFWMSDLRHVRRLEAQRREVNVALSEENTLLSAENRVREERTQYETANRLYDAIADDVQAQVSRIDSLMREDIADEPVMMQRLRECLVLGSYVKRRSNLILISRGSARIHVSELMFACRESLDSLSFCGTQCGIHLHGSSDMPAETLMKAYDAFEAVAEQAVRGCGALFVTLRAEGGLRLRVETEGLAAGDPAIPAGIDAQSEEDDGIRTFTFAFGEAG